MNGVRSIFRRKGYLFTALAAAVLLAASSGTAYAQEEPDVTIGFETTSGSVHERAFLNANSLEAPQRIKITVEGIKLAGNSRRVANVDTILGDVTITPDANVYIARYTAAGYTDATGTPEPYAADADAFGPAAVFTIDSSHWHFSDEFEIVVAYSADGMPDTDFKTQKIELRLDVGAAGVTNPASVSPDLFTLQVGETHPKPVAQFLQPDFTLSEQSERIVQLDIVSGDGPGEYIPTAVSAGRDGVVSVRVGNHHLVMFGDAAGGCPVPGDRDYDEILFRIETGAMWSETTGGLFASTGVLETAGVANVSWLADNRVDPADGTVNDEYNQTADMTIHGCGDGAGIRDPYITLTILPKNLDVNDDIKDIVIGPPLMISVDSDEAAPTLSFSPTDVYVDEGGSVDSVLLAQGPNAEDVHMVKLMVEGDAMVSLMQDGVMLEEMDGYVYVDLGGNSSVRLTAMSHMDPDLMDGEMAFKAWKLLMDGGSAEGVNIGEGYWFRVDVRGMTAVPALPLLGQLLLALFLMAGGARRYRRRQG